MALEQIIDQWNGIKKKNKRKPHLCGKLIYSKKARIYNGERVFLISAADKTEQKHLKEGN